MLYERGMNNGLNVHLYPSDLTSESRMMKITAALKDAGYFIEIRLIGILSETTQPFEKIDEVRSKHRYNRPLFLGRRDTLGKAIGTLRWSWAVWRSLSGRKVTCINCHSLPVLPLCVALKLRHGAKLIYDTHELETETTESRGFRRPLMKAMERALLPFCTATFVVGNTIADWYRDTYAMKRPYVVRNISDPAPFDASVPSPLRAQLGLTEEAILILYLGRIAPNRGIERLLRLFLQLDAPLHLVLIGDGPLVPTVQDAAYEHLNIHYLPPVPGREVVNYARGADIGVSVIDHSCLSYTYAMPNKLFEYLQAGVPVVIGDMPEQRAIIESSGAGWMMPEEDDVAALAFLQSLTRTEIDSKKANAEAVSGDYSWAKEREVLLAAYAEIFATHPKNA